MLTIGLTGGIGAGKTTVSKLFSELGIMIINADKIARELVRPPQFAYTEIIRHFGTTMLDNNMQIDRKQLRQIIFEDPHEKAWLESLLHPLIKDAIQQQLQYVTSPYCIIEIPLLTKDKSFAYLDRILVIDCEENIQFTRTQQRDNISTAEIMRIIESQLSRQQRLSIADDVIDNNANFTQLQQQINQLHHYYLSLCAKTQQE